MQLLKRMGYMPITRKQWTKRFQVQTTLNAGSNIKWVY